MPLSKIFRLTFIFFLFLRPPGPLSAAEPGHLKLSAPVDYQVFQRTSRADGKMTVAGTLDRAVTEESHLEVRLLGAGPATETWRSIAALTSGATEFHSEFEAPAGGWYRFEMRIRRDETILAHAEIDHVGMGEVFVVAGQSNSANHGEEKQQTKSGLVAAFSGTEWKLANDPQPGASGSNGSFMPPFGDAMAERFHVPVGIVAAGVGATSVREWLPKGSRFPNPPTLTNNVSLLASGEWESRGGPYAKWIVRVKQLGPHGFRAVLWHQGESDANQRDATRTLSGKLYQDYLAQLIRATQDEAGWRMPWFVAQASYHTPDDTGSLEIRSAQAALWKSGTALEGPDTDALTGDLRENRGKGVHFSAKGLQEHAARWVEKVAPWLERELGQ